MDEFNMGTMSVEGIKKRGFASQTPERKRELARPGGKRAHQLGKAHHFTREEARISGRNGGLAKKNGVS